MTGPRRRLRTRLLVAMVAIAVGVLLVTGVTTLGLTRRDAEKVARSELEEKAPDVARQLEALGQRLRGVRAGDEAGVRLGLLIASVLRISGSTLVTVAPDGTVTGGITGLSDETGLTRLHMPEGVTVSDLDVESLQRGLQQAGTRDGVVFLARPLTANRFGTPVLVLSQKIESEATERARSFFLVGAAVAALLAMVVAFFLARRLTKPLAAMSATAGRLADGDLSARVDLGRRTNDELADLARTLNGMAAQLEHARGLERAFVLSISHDLRTPLTSIRGYAEALTDGTIATTAEQQRAAAVILAEARRLERLVADLLDLARLDARQFSLTPVPTDAAAIVRTAVDAFAPAAAESGITLRVDAPNRLPADTDPERLAQIVANLVENALKYAETSVTVELVAGDGSQVDLRVRDDGPGLDPSEVSRVFDRLYTSRTVPGRTVGTGLGLAIVRELATAMGGTAWADPSAAPGATFVVRLPIARAS